MTAAAPRRATAPPRGLGVLLCSYRRPEALMRCLDALARQTRPADDVMVVVRTDDHATRAALAHRTATPNPLPIRLLDVAAPGKICALNLGLDACTTDLLAIADDDTEARPDWLARIFAHFAANPELGGIGGRDRCHDGQRFDDREREPVGRLAWWGRAIGNHHLGFGLPRPADFLKGANMSFRAEAFAGLRFDLRLRGRGAQPAEDVAFSRAIKLRGWELCYDPAVLLDHYAGERDEPRYYVATSHLNPDGGFFDNAYNNVIALADGMPIAQRAVYFAWSVLIGMRHQPGMLQAVRLTPRQGFSAWRKFLISQRALWSARRALTPR